MSLQIDQIQTALGRLKEEGKIIYGTIGAAGYGERPEHSIVAEIKGPYSDERIAEVRSMVREALPDSARQLPITVAFAK